MKICFLSSMHPHNDKRVHDKEARSLQEAGFEVVHVCPGTVGNLEGESWVSDGVRIQQYKSAKGLYARLRQLKHLYKLGADEDADVYHCNEVDSWFVGVALKILRKKKCIFDVHEHYPSTFAESRFPKLIRPIIISIVRSVFAILLPFTDRVVLAKQTVGGDFNCSNEKKVLVQNFTPIGGLSLARERKARVPNSKMTIVHLGLFGKIRGWPEVLKAIAKTDEKINLQIIGTINDGTFEEFNDKVKELGLEGRVEVLDWMPFDEAFDYLLNADVGIIAFQPHIQNHVFAMPHKLFDYMAAGMSVLMPKQAIEVAPIVDDADCGLLVDPSDFVDIANGITALFNDPESAYKMGIRGQNAVKEKYNWESEAEKLLDMYNELK